MTPPTMDNDVEGQRVVVTSSPSKEGDKLDSPTLTQTTSSGDEHDVTDCQRNPVELSDEEDDYCHNNNSNKTEPARKTYCTKRILCIGCIGLVTLAVSVTLVSIVFWNAPVSRQDVNQETGTGNEQDWQDEFDTQGGDAIVTKTMSPTDEPRQTVPSPSSPPNTKPNAPVSITEVSSPTDDPTSAPTAAPTTSPTTAPTTSPTTADIVQPLVAFLESQSDYTIEKDNMDAPSMLAAQWLAIELEDANTFSPDLVQRFGLVALDFALSATTTTTTTNNNAIATPMQLVSDASLSWSTPNVVECDWVGVVCNGTTVTEINFAKRGLDGTIPSEIRLLTNLIKLDLSDNQIHGPLPDELYELVALEGMYLYKNKLSGGLSQKIGNLNELQHLFLNHNSFTGPFPSSLRSGSDIRKLRNVNLYRNQFTGTIPQSARWRQMFSLDLGRNQFNGTIPEDLGSQSVRLRHLFLDHNKFVGKLPSSIINAGNGRLESLTIDNNRLTGEVPSDFEMINKMVIFTMQNNQFSSKLDKDVCKISVFEWGENVELKADCDICSCGAPLCQGC